MNRNLIFVLAAAGAAALCCLCLLLAGGAAAYTLLQATALAPVLTDVFVTATPSPVPVIVLTPPPTPVAGGEDTLTALENAEIPINDLRELAMRLKGIPDIPVIVGDKPADYPPGATLQFFASNTDTNAHFTVTARLIYKTENVYFFAQEGLDVDEAQVKKLVDDFQNKTYLTDRQFFGSEPNPGIDGDPHLYILFARGLGVSVAGYQSSADGYSQLAHPYSNEKEMFYINADATAPNDPSLPGTLAHEFQHMIHGYHDLNEETWMNEGSSVLAEFLNGYSADGFDSYFLNDPDIQLNAWSENGPGADSIPHYGAGFLFMNYFLDRFGSEVTQALVADPANGLRAVDDVLAAKNITDPVTGRALTANDVFADWVIANYLGDTKVRDGRYGYHNYSNAPKVSFPTESFRSCPVPPQQFTVHQYAADYYEIDCAGKFTIAFTGSQQVNVVPTEPHSGRYAFWSHRNDKSDTTLTREFDFTSLASATLRYWAWWAIEKDYDYAYLEVSADGGKTWKIVDTPSCTTSNPAGNSFGCAYNDNSGGESAVWVNETVDLSAYAGRKIQIRFEYITDDAVTRPGFMLDDISIPELNYTADFENGSDGWTGAGFVRIDNLLPQTFIVQLIRQEPASQQTTVERVPLDSANRGSVTLDMARGSKAVLVVSGTTPFTTEVASYQFEVK